MTLTRFADFLRRIIQEQGTTDHQFLVVEATRLLADLPTQALDDLAFIEQLCELWRHHAKTTANPNEMPGSAVAAFVNTLTVCAEELGTRIKLVRELRPTRPPATADSLPEVVMQMRHAVAVSDVHRMPIADRQMVLDWARLIEQLSANAS